LHLGPLNVSYLYTEQTKTSKHKRLSAVETQVAQQEDHFHLHYSLYAFALKDGGLNSVIYFPHHLYGSAHSKKLIVNE